MKIRAKYQSFEARFFSNLGVLNTKSKSSNCYNWRLDYPSIQEASKDEKFVILICQKILLRGKQVLLSS